MDLNQYTVESSGTLLDVAQVIASNLSRCAIVISDDKTIGVISEGDLVRALLRGTDIYSPLQPFINHGFTFMREHDLSDALELFRTLGISLIPILSNEMYLSDVITLQQVLSQVSLVKLGNTS